MVPDGDCRLYKVYNVYIYIYTPILRMHDHFILQSFKFDFHGPIQIHRHPLGLEQCKVV